MNSSNIEYLLQQLGCDKIRNGGDAVYASCPLARWKHRKGRDEHPSFSVMVDNGAISGARCHTGTCNFSGSLLFLIFEIEKQSNRDLDDLADFVRMNNGPSWGTGSSRIKKRRAAEEFKAELSAPTEAEKRIPVYDWDREIAGLKGVTVDWVAKLDGLDDLPVLPESALNAFTKVFPPAVQDYLTGQGPSEYGTKRRLSPEMIKTWELCWDSKYKKIVFPIRDCKKRLVGHSQRSFTKKSEEAKGPKYMHTKGFRRDFYVYGESLWTPGGTGCIVEGFFDVHRLRAYGYQPGAVMGSHLSEFQIEKFVRNFEFLVIVPDGDPAGYEAAERWYRQVRDRLPTRVVKTPEGMDPDDFSPDFAARTIGVSK